MTTEENEIKSAEWRTKNLSKNSVSASGPLLTLQMSDKEYKELMKIIYLKDQQKFRRR